jgi:hypothetical protein
MIDELLRLCNYPIDGRMTLSMKRHFPQLSKIANRSILIPLQSSLTVNLPPVSSMNNRDKRHNVFDPSPPTFQGRLFVQPKVAALTDSMQFSTMKSKSCSPWQSHEKSPYKVPMALHTCSFANRKTTCGRMHASWILMVSSTNSSRRILILGEGNFVRLNELKWYGADFF